MNPDPEARFDGAQVLSHPWILFHKGPRVSVASGQSPMDRYDGLHEIPTFSNSGLVKDFLALQRDKLLASVPQGPFIVRSEEPARLGVHQDTGTFPSGGPPGSNALLVPSGEDEAAVRRTRKESEEKKLDALAPSFSHDNHAVFLMRSPVASRGPESLEHLIVNHLSEGQRAAALQSLRRLLAQLPLSLIHI
eukprot:TRINITY_DN12157_c0_g1_i1.p1 TRINITY_DN12157_c0_g1~~TRINITY_DN12157_c0_g1_i1.p1  ORF type:complete len:192 (-),score=31.73 TRINITY_DN12157_c0_g1_i1:78-653(-)